MIEEREDQGKLTVVVEKCSNHIFALVGFGCFVVLCVKKGGFNNKYSFIHITHPGKKSSAVGFVGDTSNHKN